MVKFRDALAKCVSEIDTIIDSDCSVSGERLLACSQNLDAHLESDITRQKEGR